MKLFSIEIKSIEKKFIKEKWKKKIIKRLEKTWNLVKYFHILKTIKKSNKKEKNFLFRKKSKNLQNLKIPQKVKQK